MKRTKIILYTCGLIAFQIALSGCGELPGLRFSPLLHDAQAGSAGLNSEERLVTLSGPMQMVSEAEYVEIIAPKDFSGKVLEVPFMEMTLQVASDGYITAGEFQLWGRDKELHAEQPYYVYRASCSEEGNQCGRLKRGDDGGLSIELHDEKGWISINSRRSINGGHSFVADVSMDGHTIILGEAELTDESTDLANIN